ncbi:MAG: glycerophosphodiester phosphodiesterase [Actinomycetota bacterium]
MAAIGRAPAGPKMRRVGHKGADHIAPGNTLASFDAALAHDVDMIEFDILPTDPHADRMQVPLILAHDYTVASVADSPSLEDGLAHFASDAFANVELDVDLKLPGYEDRVVEALRRYDLVHRSLISTMYPESLARIREIEPNVRLGLSVPHVRKDYTSSALTIAPALIGLFVYRALLPRRAYREISEGRCDAIMAHWRLVTPKLVRAVNRAGGDLYVWTVDDLARIQSLERLGVTGVISNDPRLFDALV